MYNYFYFLYLQPAPPIDDEADDAHPLEEAESEMDMSGPFNSDTDDGSFHSVCRSDSESESDAEVQEPSLLEETLPPDYSDDEGTVTYELVERGTQRRALLLVDSLGYSYGKYDRTKAGQKWRCTQRNATQLWDHHVTRKFCKKVTRHSVDGGTMNTRMHLRLERPQRQRQCEM